MADGNLAFLAKQLMQTELRGHNWTDRAGGSYAAGRGLWTVIWDAAAAGDPEKLVQECEARAGELSLPFAGLIALSTPLAEADPALTAIEEALYVYGYPRRQGLGVGGPDMVQVLTKPPHHKPLAGLAITPAAAAAGPVAELLAEAAGQEDGLGGPGWAETGDYLDPALTHLAAMRGAETLGFVSLGSAGVTGRIVLAWVKPEARGAGIGKQLLLAAARQSADSGQLVLSAWTHRDGRLRFYFAQEGFNEQLRIHYFMPEAGA